MSFSKRIKELRIKNKMTQEELGELLGVQKSAINKYENGRIQNLKMETAEKLSEIFGVPTTYILGVENDPFTLNKKTINYLDNFFFENPHDSFISVWFSKNEVYQAYSQALKMAIMHKKYIENEDGKISFESKMEKLCIDAVDTVVVQQDFSNKGAINKTVDTLRDLEHEIKHYFYEIHFINNENIFLDKLRKNADEDLYLDLKKILEETYEKLHLIQKYYK